MVTFISRIAQELIDGPGVLHEKLVLLPNQRAELFLREALKEHVSGTALLPMFTTVDQFIAQAANLVVVEPLALMVRLFDCYENARMQALPQGTSEGLGSFLNWGQTLLGDFGEIDRYLLNPKHVLGDLYNVQKLAEWDLEPGEETPLMRRYSDFIALLPATYEAFTASLLEDGEAYSGLAARHLATNPEAIAAYLSKNGVTQVLIAGLNALNTAELSIIQSVREACPTQTLWDIDPHYFNDTLHEAGHFLRSHVQRQKVFGKDVPSTKGMASEWKTLPKDIYPVGASQYTGQAKAVAGALDELRNAGVSPKDIAVVLADESLLNPVLSFLPEAYDKVNITMGYPLDQTALAGTVRLWITVIEYALKNQRRSEKWTFYYRSLCALFTDPLFNKYWSGPAGENPLEWNAEIVKGNRVFTSASEWVRRCATGPKGYAALFEAQDPKGWMTALQSWLKHVGRTEEHDPLVQNTAYHIHTLLAQLSRTLTIEVEPLVLLKLIKQQLRGGTVDFVGEPLEGLQIMGILESRTLDFKHVVLAGVNEGVLPAGRRFNSLLPYDIKRNYGLPTYEEKDAVYAYHFYRIQQRCLSSTITFNTDTEAMGGGEPSRFLVQLEHELKNTACTVHPRTFLQGPVAPNSMEQLFSAEKTPSVVQAFEAWMARGISASSLNELTGMPDRFYQKRLIRVKEEEEVEEQVSAMVMGNLIHKGLEKVYEPFVGKPITNIDIDQWTAQAYEAGLTYLIEVERYSKSALNQGRNLLTLEICKKMIRQFLQYDARRAEQGTLVLKGVETKLDFEMLHPTLQLPMKFNGVVDRLEVYENAFIIWDYKSGAIGPSDLSLSGIDDLWIGSKGKPLQILLYAWLLWKKELVSHPFPWHSGMFKLQSGQPEHLLRGAALGKSNDITEELLRDFEKALCDYLAEVHSNGLPFVEKPKYEFN